MRRMTQIEQVRRHALRLRKSGLHNSVAPSLLSNRLVESNYAETPELELIAQAKRVLQAARLTAFTVTTKAEAVSIIEGIRPAGRSYAR
jgi:hypothetical protein